MKYKPGEQIPDDNELDPRSFEAAVRHRAIREAEGVVRRVDPAYRPRRGPLTMLAEALGEQLVDPKDAS